MAGFGLFEFGLELFGRELFRLVLPSFLFINSVIWAKIRISDAFLEAISSYPLYLLLFGSKKQKDAVPIWARGNYNLSNLFP
jgi:hypothetical protein